MKNDQNISFQGIGGVLVGFIPWVLGWVWIILTVAGWLSG